MTLKFVQYFGGDGLDVSYTVFEESEKEVGTAEGYLNTSGELVSVIKIGTDYQKMGFGYSIFKKVFDTLNEKIAITKIIGSWHSGEEFSYCEDGMSTNLKLFKKCVSENNDPEDCAFLTPTGKWAMRLGFNKCRVVKRYHDEVTIEFYKDYQDKHVDNCI